MVGSDFSNQVVISCDRGWKIKDVFIPVQVKDPVRIPHVLLNKKPAEIIAFPVRVQIDGYGFREGGLGRQLRSVFKPNFQPVESTRNRTILQPIPSVSVVLEGAHCGSIAPKRGGGMLDGLKIPEDI